MLQQLKQFKEKHPFTALMLIAIAVRIIAVAFVPDFGSHHELQHPSLIHDFLEWLKNAIGLSGSPKVQFVSRTFYALISLFTVSMIYRICDLIAGKSNAWIIALIPTICCIMPSFGIIENICAFLGLPLVLYGSNIVLRQEVLRKANMHENVHRTSFYVAGIMFGLGIAVWYESALIALSVLLIIALKRNRKGVQFTFIGLIITLVIIYALLLILHVNPWGYVMI